MEITGNIVRVLETEVRGENQFKTRAIHVKTIEEYPQTVELQFTQGNVTLLDNKKEGEKVKITYNLKGREYIKEGKTLVFNTLQGWKIEKLA